MLRKLVNISLIALMFSMSEVIAYAGTTGSEELKKSIEQKVKGEKSFANIELETKTDESLIGGFVLEFNNNLVDASILRDLKDIKKQFLQNLYVQQLR